MRVVSSRSSPIRLRKHESSDYGAALIRVPSLAIDSGTIEMRTPIGDAVYDLLIEAVTWDDGPVVTTSANHAIQGEFKSMNPAVATVSPIGEITKVSDGVCMITMTGGLVNMFITVDLISRGGATAQEWVSSIKGSLGSHISNNVDSKIDLDTTMAANGKVFTTQNHTSAPPLYVRNPNLWCADYDLTGISPWNSTHGFRKAGVVVSPRHVMSAAHYCLTNQTIIRFVDADGNIVEREIIGTSSLAYDFCLHTLSSDLPPSIARYEVISSDFSDYVFAIKENRIPTVLLDQEEKVLVADSLGFQPYYSDRWNLAVPQDPDRARLHEWAIGGDSGNPAFHLIEGKLVLVMVLTWLGGHGIHVGKHIADINAMISASDTQAGVTGPVADPTWPNAGDHYQVKEADFSAWPNFTTKDYVVESSDLPSGNASVWKDVNGDGSVYRYYKNDLADYEEARVDGGVWKIYDEADSLIATGNAGGGITAATFDNGYSFSNP